MTSTKSERRIEVAPKRSEAVTLRLDNRPDRTEETSPYYAGWRVTFVCFVIAVFSWGFGFYGHGVYLAELRRLNGWPASLISGATTVYYLFSAMLVVFVSDAIRRLGPRRLVLSGIACLGVSAALLGSVRTPWQLFAVYLVMSFGWATMSVGAITNIVGLWFEHRRGLAISLALTGASSGGIVVIPALVVLIGEHGFATAMVIASLVMMVILVPLTLLWIREPASDALPASAARRGAPVAGWTRAMALRSFRFWTITGPFALALVAQVGFLVHQIAFLEPTIGRSQAATAVAITVTMSIIGRLGFGLIIDRLNQRVASAVSLASQAAALLVMAQTTQAMPLFIACAVFGFSVGNMVTFPALIVQREFEAASFGLLIALSTAIGQFTYALGPGLIGVIRDATGGYPTALMLCAVLELIAAGIVLLQRPPAKPISCSRPI
jgi:MFS family permease